MNKKSDFNGFLGFHWFYDGSFPTQKNYNQ